MNSRAEAVAYLTSLGFHARERDCSLGESIAVCSEPEQLSPELRIFRRGVYIYAREGLWSIWNVMSAHLMEDERRFPLREACDIAAEILRNE
jgi:hypothetical protein